MYHYEQSGDFKKYFDTELKINYWVLGYFGGGSIVVSDAYNVAKDFSEAVGIDIETVRIDIIQKSTWAKYFKFVFSDAENQRPASGAHEMKGVYQYLTS